MFSLKLKKHIRFIKLGTFFASKSQWGGLRPSLNLSGGGECPPATPLCPPLYLILFTDLRWTSFIIYNLEYNLTFHKYLFSFFFTSFFALSILFLIPSKKVRETYVVPPLLTITHHQNLFIKHIVVVVVFIFKHKIQNNIAWWFSLK